MKNTRIALLTLIMSLCLMMSIGLSGCGSDTNNDESAAVGIRTETDMDAGADASKDSPYIGEEKAKEIALEAAAKETGKDKEDLIALNLMLDSDEYGEQYKSVDEDGLGIAIYVYTIDDKDYLIDALNGDVLEIRDTPEDSGD